MTPPGESGFRFLVLELDREVRKFIAVLRSEILGHP
jgi:hypothetical protein